MLLFASAVFLLIITPGPGVLSTAGIGAAYGAKTALNYLIGLFIGTNLVALAVISGLAALVFSIPHVRTVLLVASACYLLYLGARIAFAGSKIGFINPKNKPSLGSGIALQIINPKAYAVNTTLFSGFAFWQESLLIETTLKFIIMNAIWIPIHLLWMWAGISINRLELDAKIQFRINVLMALAMLLVVALAIAPVLSL